MKYLRSWPPPQTTGDRYRIIATTPPGGRTGYQGFRPANPPRIDRGVPLHIGDDAGAGRAGTDRPRTRRSRRGATRDHPRLSQHQGPALFAVDLIFTTPGPRPEADLIQFAVILDRLIRDRRVSRITGLPPATLQALLLRKRFNEAMDQPGLRGLLIGPLAALGHLRRYPIEYPPNTRKTTSEQAMVVCRRPPDQRLCGAALVEQHLGTIFVKVITRPEAPRSSDITRSSSAKPVHASTSSSTSPHASRDLTVSHVAGPTAAPQAR